MLAISLWQPWASLWLSDRKIHETRHWQCRRHGRPLRGTIAVHAAKRFIRDVEEPLRDILESEFGGHWAMDLPTGALLGTVELIACVPTMGEGDRPVAASDDDLACGDFSPGRFAWRRGGYRLFRRPIPYRGAQGFFHVPDELLRDGE